MSWARYGNKKPQDVGHSNGFWQGNSSHSTVTDHAILCVGIETVSAQSRGRSYGAGGQILEHYMEVLKGKDMYAFMIKR